MSAQRPAVPSMWGSTLLVAEREITTQVRTKAFLVSTAITLVLVLAGIVAPSLFGSGDDATKVAVVASTSAVVESAEGLDAVLADDADQARRLVADEEVEAAVLPGGGAVGLTVVGLTSAPTEVVGALSVSPTVELLEGDGTSEGLRMLVSLAFGLVFMMSAMGSGSMIAQNTVQEKQTRIVEILLSAVPARALLAGKILGNSVVAFGQTASIAVVAVVGLVVTSQDDLLGVLGSAIVWFVVFFLVGFVLVAAIFAASASLVSRQEDVGSVLSPVMMLVMIPYFLVLVFNDNAFAMAVMSYVPFSATVGMPVRLFLGEAQWWEPLLSMGILITSTLVVTAIAARIYSGSLLRMGGRTTVREALQADA